MMRVKGGKWGEHPGGPTGTSVDRRTERVPVGSRNLIDLITARVLDTNMLSAARRTFTAPLGSALVREPTCFHAHRLLW